MLNNVCLAGRLTADPELKYTPSGVPVCNFAIAVDRDFKDAEGNRETDFFDIVTWRKTAELVAEYTKKGRLVDVTGRLQTRTYEGEQGRRKVYEVVADRVHFLDRKEAAE